jgi:hypothetical protein
MDLQLSPHILLHTQSRVEQSRAPRLAVVLSWGPWSSGPLSGRRDDGGAVWTSRFTSTRRAWSVISAHIGASPRLAKHRVWNPQGRQASDIIPNAYGSHGTG